MLTCCSRFWSLAKVTDWCWSFLWEMSCGGMDMWYYGSTTHFKPRQKPLYVRHGAWLIATSTRSRFRQGQRDCLGRTHYAGLTAAAENVQGEQSAPLFLRHPATFWHPKFDTRPDTKSQGVKKVLVLSLPFGCECGWGGMIGGASCVSSLGDLHMQTFSGGDRTFTMTWWRFWSQMVIEFFFFFFNLAWILGKTNKLIRFS